MKKTRFIILFILIGLAILTIATNVIPQKWVFLVSLAVFGGILYIPVICKTIFPKFLPDGIRSTIALLFQFSLIVFVCLSLVLGSFFKFYEDFIWWDLFLHFVAGVIFALPGYSLIYKGAKDVKNYMAFWVPFFVSMTASALWEIYEFAGDVLFKMHMQGNGVSDTMEDLTACFVAAVATSVGLYFLTKKYNPTNSVHL